MKTFLDDPAVKADVLAQLAEHRRLDQIVQGTYWENNKGCAVGCLTHNPAGGHAEYETRWGIPEWLARLEDTIFEGLPTAKAKLWPERFMTAIPVGVEITDRLADRLAVARLREQCLPLASGWPESVREQVVTAIKQIISVLEADERDLATRSAAGRSAESAESAAWSAESAAWSARSAWSAESAAWSAESAAWSAWLAWAAESAARSARSAARSARSAESARSARSAWAAEADRTIAALRETGAG